jgi:hypothetical protein
MNAAKLACPKCKRSVPEVYWQGVDLVRCPSCEAEFEQLRFPALAAARQVDRAASLASGEAHCFFHSQNRAEAACDGCGRFICAVCRVPFAGKQFCPSCLEARADRSKLPENHRIVYDHLAMLMAVLPILMWPVTILTAPAALGLSIYGWRKPGSIVRGPSRARFIVAGIFASLQIVGWMVLLAAMILH